MLTDIDELVPVLTVRGRDEAIVGEHPLARAVVEAAWRGDECLCELFERLVNEGHALADPSALLRAVADAPVAWVPRPVRSAFAWVVVALRGELEPALLADVCAACSAERPGLVLAARAPTALPDHVEVVARGGAPDGALDDTPDGRFALAQLARSVLRSIPPARVLLAGVEDGAVLADSLEGHAVGLVLDGRTLSASADPGAVDRIFPRAVGVFLREADARTAVRSRGFEGALLPVTAAALASHLTPNESALRVRGPAVAERRLRELASTARDPWTAPRRVLYACPHLLGDTVAATAVLREHRRRFPDDHVTFLVADEPYARVFELCGDVDRLAFVTVRDQEELVYAPSSPWVAELDYVEGFDVRHFLDVQAAAGLRADGEDLHMAECYARLAGLELASRRPSLDRARALAHAPADAPDGPFVLFARHTVSGRAIGPQHAFTKRWAEGKWLRLAERVRRGLGLSVVSIGTSAEARLESPHALDLHDLSILEVAGLVARARAVVCVDNGIYHLAQGLAAPLVHLLPDWLGDAWTAAAPDTPHRDVSAKLRTLSVARVERALRTLLTQADGSRGAAD